MAEFKLSDNQAALILGVSDEGEIQVDMAVAATENEATNLAAAICRVIAMRLVNDEQFQEEIMTAIDNEMNETPE